LPPAPAHHYRVTYSETDLQKLIRDFDIPELHRDGLGPLLEDMAAIWRWHQSPVSERIRPTKMSAALQKIAKLADQLEKALQDLPSPAKAALDVAYSEAEIAAHLALNDDQPPPKGVAFNAPQADGTPLIVQLETEEIRDVIAHVAVMATQAADLPSAKAGTKRDKGLRMWMANVEIFWTETLGRSFSRDVTSTGEPISAAARFCVAAFAFVSPHTPPSRVLQEMKLCIKATRKKIAGRIAHQNDA
jgi:hypothetical protein